jgi:hypothetical protein
MAYTVIHRPVHILHKIRMPMYESIHCTISASYFTDNLTILIVIADPGRFIVL